MSSQFLLVHLQRLGLLPGLANVHGSGEKSPILMRPRLNPNSRKLLRCQARSLVEA